MKKHILYILLIITASAHAQDPQLSHLYAVPLHLGPSFAGSAGATRLALNVRDQWMAVKREHVTYSVMADHHFYGTRSGLGIMYMSDFAGLGYLTTNTLQLQYAMNFNVSSKVSFRPGLGVSYVSRSVDYSRLTFGDQLDYVDNRPVTIEPDLQDERRYADFSASLLGIFGNYWAGATVDHLAQPNQSLNNGDMRVPMRYVAYVGGRFTINTIRNNRRKREKLYVMLHYNQQDNFKQAYMGTYWERNMLIAGFWYRGLPFLRAYDKNINTDAVVFMVGARYGKLLALYSYDFSASKLAVKSGGSHEVTVTWKFGGNRLIKNKKKHMNSVSCPMSDEFLNHKKSRQRDAQKHQPQGSTP